MSLSFYSGCLIFADVLGLLWILSILVERSLVFSVVVVSGVGSSISVVIVFSGLSVVVAAILVIVVFSIISVVIFVERSVVVFEATFMMSRSFFDNIPAIVSIACVAFSVVSLSVSRTSVVVSSRLLHLTIMTLLTLLVLCLLLSFVGMIATFSWRSIGVFTVMIALLISFLLWFFSSLSLLTSCSVLLSVSSSCMSVSSISCMSVSSSSCMSVSSSSCMSVSSSSCMSVSSSCMSVLHFFNLCMNFSTFSDFNLMLMFLLLIVVMFLLLLLSVFLFFVMSMMLLVLLNSLLLLLMSVMMVMMRASWLFLNDDGCLLNLRDNEDHSFFNFSDWFVVMAEFLRRDSLSNFQLEVTLLASHVSS